MSDDEQQQQTQQDGEVKSEDPNATINIKVRGSMPFDVLMLNLSRARLGLECTRGGGLFQDQAKYEAQQAPGSLCYQSGQGRKQHPVSRPHFALGGGRALLRCQCRLLCHHAETIVLSVGFCMTVIGSTMTIHHCRWKCMITVRFLQNLVGFM
jgi:hypothetical protein